MASGAQHEAASTELIILLQPLLLGLTAAAVVAYGLDYVHWEVTILVGVGAFGFLFGLYVGRRVTPDLDIDEVITRQTRRYMERHRILGWVWRIYWYPYALIHPHRGVSHVPVVGTMGRWLYLFALPILMCTFLLWRLPFELVCFLLFWLTQFGGQVAQDLLHIWMDR